MEDLSFNDVDCVSRSQSSLIGGPVIGTGLSTYLNHQLTAAQKRAAFDTYVSNSGYQLFDLTKITTVSANNDRDIVNGTSFATFFSIWLIILIAMIILMATDMIGTYVGLYLLLIFSIILYIASVIYRMRLLSTISSSTDS